MLVLPLVVLIIVVIWFLSHLPGTSFLYRDIRHSLRPPPPTDDTPRSITSSIQRTTTSTSEDTSIMKSFVLLISWHLMASALATAFSSPITTNVKRVGGWNNKKQDNQLVWRQHEVVDPSTVRRSVLQATAIRGGATSSSGSVALLGFASSLGSAYASWLERRPIITKSVTASLIFGLSDYLAQVLEARSSSSKAGNAKPTASLNARRIIWAMAVGLLYFGPAAHVWYDNIFRLLPGTSLLSTLQKAALGQLIFGPSFTCIFFATTLIQSGQWSFNAWFKKIAQDLPKAWLAGVGFWPLMDLISYSFISREWIPLFINCCSLVWTIYLSLIANRSR